MRTLLVEDDESTRDLISTLLERRGHEVTACEDAEHAWEEFRKTPYGLAVIDLMLPGKIDGLELCRQIRGHAAGRESTLMVCTARSRPEDLEAVLDSGADDYLSKPFDPIHFQVRVRIAEHLARIRNDRRIIEESLQELSGNLELAQAAILGHTADGVLVSMNAHAEKLFGYTADEVRGKADPLVPDDRHGELHELLEQLKRGERIEHYETVRVRKDGTRLTVLLNQAPIYDQSGNLIGARSVVRDVSSDRLVAEKLRLTEERLRGLFDSPLIGVFFFDIAGRITHANDTFLKMLRYTREDLVSGALDWMRLSHPFYADHDRAAVAQLSKRGAFDPFEKEYVRKDGSQLPVLVGGAALKSSNREGVAFALDLSNRKLLEEQLRQSQKMDAIGRLAGGIAHDFNNLLTIIIGRSELALTQMKREDINYNTIDLIRSTGTRAAGLTRQLLQFSRQQVLQPKIVNLLMICNDMREMLQRLLGETIELSIISPPSPRLTKVDPTQIQQVILNLVTNARDAIQSRGKITIELADFDLTEDFTRSHPGVQPGPHVMLSVADTGCGMTETVRSRLFEPFFTTKEQGKGTGLGLSTVYGIVKQSGGDIWVYSEPGHGTIFKVYFPAVSGTVATESNSVMKPVESGGETILVVEDEETIATLLRDVLSEAGYKLLVAFTPQQALELSSKEAHIDLLLTDIVMPGMSGRELANVLSQNRPSLKVLFMSGYTSNTISDHGILDPGVSLLEKPFTPRSLVKKVREVLDSQPL